VWIRAGDDAGSGKGVLATWDALASTLPADIPDQPSMLEGGTLRDYQMQVRGLTHNSGAGACPLYFGHFIFCGEYRSAVK
jgi:hypothetical protein